MRDVIVVGGGLAGMGAAFALASAGIRRVTILERGPQLGGLAGTLEVDGRFYPLAYHHVLSKDRTLLWFLERIGALPRVRWRRISMRFQHGGRTWDLRRASELMRFPLPLADKARLVRLMLKSFRKQDWSDWIGRDAATLLDAWGGQNVRTMLFEPLTRLKFGLPCREVSAAWMGARLHHREGSAPLGYVPGTNWTKVLVEGIESLLRAERVEIRTGCEVRRLHGDDGALRAAELEGGETLEAAHFVCALPTTAYLRLVPDHATPRLGTIRYTAIVSAVCATRQPLEPDFYWLNLTALETSACGLFRLDSLNPTIGAPGEACLNFVTHVPAHDRSFLDRDDERIARDYAADFGRIFGRELAPEWMRITRLPSYSPVFDAAFDNPPPRSATWRNVWFAGNYRTFPSVASTGTALGSGLDAAQAILAELGHGCVVSREVERFRLSSAPAA